jgi:site-specific recombinase XerD
MGSSNRTIDKWLSMANNLCQEANTAHYNRMLEQAWTLFMAFCASLAEQACPASCETIMAFMAWMVHIGKASQTSEHLTSISRRHLEAGLADPTKEFRLKQLSRAIHKHITRDKVAQWPRDPLPVNALCNYHYNPPSNSNPTLWRRDLALVALGLRTMRRPSELCNLNLNDFKWDGSRLWLRINRSKTDVFANGRFLPIEITNSPTCPVTLLLEYLKVRPHTCAKAPLFLAQNGNRMTPGAVNSVVKRVAEHLQLQGRFSGHSLRIGGATAAMEAGLSLEQIQSIGGWKSPAVHLYLRLVGTAQLGTSQKMGF